MLRRDWSNQNSLGDIRPEQIAALLGEFTFSAAHIGLSFDRLDPEARAPLWAVRNVELNGIEIDSQAKDVPGVALSAAADEVLVARGWARVAGILDGDHVVAVYVRVDSPSSNNMKGFVVAFGEKAVGVGRVRLWNLCRNRRGCFFECGGIHPGATKCQARCDKVPGSMLTDHEPLSGEQKEGQESGDGGQQTGGKNLEF